MVKAIIFDMWGTLIENGVYPSPLRQVKNMLRVRMPFPIFVHKFEEAFMTKEFDSHLDGFKAAADALEVSPPAFVFDKLVGLWNKYMIVAKPYDETFEVLEELKKKYKLVLVSNSDAINCRQVLEKFEMTERFDDVIVSYDVGKLKGDKEFFKIVLDRLGMTKNEVIMIGDSVESDMESAQDAGIKGILIDRRDRREFEPKITALKQIEEKLTELENE